MALNGILKWGWVWIFGYVKVGIEIPHSKVFVPSPFW